MSWLAAADSIICMFFPRFARWHIVVVSENGYEHQMPTVRFHWVRSARLVAAHFTLEWFERGRDVRFAVRPVR